MNGYTVTVAPDGAHEATAVIRYEFSGGTPRVTNFSLVAADGHSLSTARVPAIDFEKLLDAVLPAVAAGPAIAVNTAPRAIGEPLSTGAVSPAGPWLSAVTGKEAVGGNDVGAAKARRARAPRSVPTKAKPAKTAPGKATATAKTAEAAKSVKKTSATKAAPRKAAASAMNAAAAKPSKTATSTPITRNTIPDTFVQVYRQAPTRTAIADYFQVKDYTAQSWIKTARRRGLIPDAG